MDEDLKIYLIYLKLLHPELSKNQIKSRKAYFKKTHIIDKKCNNYLDPEYSHIDVKFYLFKINVYLNNEGFFENRIKDFDIQKFTREHKYKTYLPVAFVKDYYNMGIYNPPAESNMKCVLNNCLKTNEFNTPIEKLFYLINEKKYYKFKNPDLFITTRNM
tara:strand:+ start:210 stop:689 length:480 start_codon:yes stop_codon:yes gene_type:complete